MECECKNVEENTHCAYMLLHKVLAFRYNGRKSLFPEMYCLLCLLLLNQDSSLD